MKLFRVFSGVATIGAGEAVALTEAQGKPRLHNLDRGFEPQRFGEDRFIVKGTTPLQFKTGEVIGLEELPRRLIDNLVPVDGPDSEEQLAAAVRAEEAEKAAAKRRQQQEQQQRRPHGKRGR